MPHLTTRDGTDLFYTDWGTGRPVVLIHGWPLSSAFWEYQARVLAEAGYRVVAYDRRGFGRSDQPWSGYDYDTLVDDLADVLSTLDLSKVTLVGFSMGGGEVARYLSRHGTGRVAQAVLIAAVTPFLLKTDDHPEGVDKAVYDEMVDAVERDRPAYLEGFARSFFGIDRPNSTISEGIIRWYMQLALQAAPHATILTARAWSETDFRPDMASFTVPTLVLHGGGDENVPAAIAGRAAAAAIPGSRYVEYEGAQHAVIIDSAARVNADLLAFLGQALEDAAK